MLVSVALCVIAGLLGLSIAQRVIDIDTQWSDYEQDSLASAEALNLTISHFGYGGFIDHFKSYILHKDPELVEKLDKDLREIYRALDAYPLDAGHPQVRDAVESIRKVINQYAEKYKLSQQLINAGSPSNEIDQLVRVDDRPALEAFKFLSQHVGQHNHEQRNKTKAAVESALGLLRWSILLLPLILLVGGIIVRFIRYNLRINDQLKATNRYLGDVFAAAPDPMLIISTDGRITDSNARASELFGYSHEEFIQLCVEDIIPERYRKNHPKQRAGAFSNSHSRPINKQAEFKALTKQGREVPVEISLNYTMKDNRRQAITTLRDATERKRIETELRRHRNMLQKAQSIAQIGSWEWDITTNKLSWSDEIFQIFGLSPEQFGLSYDSFVEHLHPDDRENVVNAVNESVVFDKPYSIEHRIIRPDGEERIVQERGDVFRDEEGEAQYMVGTMLDITEQKRIENEFRLADNVFSHTSEAIMVTDARNRILRINQAFTIITGYSEEDVIGHQPNAFLKSDKQGMEFYAHLWFALFSRGFWEGEIWDRRKDGSVFPSWHNISAIKDEQGKIIQYTSIFSDITDKKIAEEHIQQLAQFDQLTQLPNRVLFNDRLHHAITRAKRSKSNIGLMFIDLDRFKSVNDTLGHHAGDQLLQEIARRLSACVREQDTVARLGGDEFTIILEELRHAEDAAIVSNKILEALSHKVQLGKHEVTVGGSIGISIYPDDGPDAEHLIKNADMAMYQAKNQGKNQHQFYTAELSNVASTRFYTENRLRQALVKEEFELYYQPQIDTQLGRIVGAEALIRWNDPEKGLIVPAHFISLAEEMGLIDPIGDWVLATACKQAMAWQLEGYEPIRMSVNVSGYQIMQGSIVESLEQVLNETQLAPEFLELEITESFVMEHPQRGTATVNELRNHGVSIAIDDFGTGYSSLSYLKQLPINRLKIDRSFVMDIPKDKDDEAIVTTIIAMANSLGLSVIAEGVENIDQVRFLNEQGCVNMQGYYFGKPLPRDEFVKLLQQPLPPLR